MSTCRASLPANTTSCPVRHRSIEEIWYVLAGSGDFYCSGIDEGKPFRLSPGVHFLLPAATEFQFRSDRDGPLEVFIVTAPPWPGDEEAQQASGVWPSGQRED